MQSKSLVTAALIVIGMTAGIGTLHAHDAPDALTQKVAFSDLNLDSDAGAKVFYMRLAAAANQVCAPLARRDLMLAPKWQSCYDNALGAAIASVDKSKVTALYQKVSKPADPAKFASLR